MSRSVFSRYRSVCESTGPSVQVWLAVCAAMQRVFVQEAPEAHLLTVVSIPGGIVIAELVDYFCSERETIGKKLSVMFVDEAV